MNRISNDRDYFVDMDFRRTPKTKTFCAVCQRDIKGKPAGYVYLGDEPGIIINPTNLSGSELKVPIGSECLKRIPSNFIVKESVPVSKAKELLSKLEGDSYLVTNTELEAYLYAALRDTINPTSGGSYFDDGYTTDDFSQGSKDIAKELIASFLADAEGIEPGLDSQEASDVLWSAQNYEGRSRFITDKLFANGADLEKLAKTIQPVEIQAGSGKELKLVGAKSRREPIQLNKR